MKSLLQSLVAIFCLTAITLKSNAQCSVSVQSLDSRNSISELYTKYDEIPVGAHDGVFENFYFCRILLGYKDKTKVPIDFDIQILYGKNSVAKDLIPRQINLWFENGSSIVLKAETESTDREFLSYLYPLTDNEVDLIEKNALSSLDFVDFRENHQVSCKPYKYLFSEGIQCLSRKLVLGY